MRFILAFIFITFSAFASEVPSISPEDFSSDDSASAIWSILAGEGIWGAFLFGAIGLIWRFAKPYLEAWIAEKKLGTLYEFARTAVTHTRQTYTDAMKSAGADGKWTEAEKNEALSRCRRTFIALCKTQGIDVVREYGEDFIEWLIEKFVGDDSLEAKALKAVALPLSVPTVQTGAGIPQPPLPDLQPLQPFAQHSAMQGKTGAASGLANRVTRSAPESAR